MSPKTTEIAKGVIAYLDTSFCNKRAPFKDIHAFIALQFPNKKKWSNRSLTDNLRNYALENGLSKRIEISRHDSENPYVCFKGKDRTTLDIRTASFPELKRLIADCFWHFIYGMGDKSWKFTNCENHEKDSEDHDYVVITGNESDWETKLGRIRAKSTVFHTLDAGSTTHAATLSFVELAESIPLQVENKYIVPIFMTNSLQIASTIVSSKFRHEFEENVWLIGGQLKLERGSIVGFPTMNCLDAWAMTTDVVLLGSTGLRTDTQSNLLSLGCDSMSEASLKSRMLLENGRIVRAIIFDSSKSGNAYVSNVFAPITKDALDIIITDCGEHTEIGKDRVSDLVEKAVAQGVSVLKVNSSSLGSDPESS